MDDYRQIHIQRLATSNIEERFLLICKGRYYEVSRAIILYALAELLKFNKFSAVWKKYISNIVTITIKVSMYFR